MKDAREYLSQIRCYDMRISAKLAELDSLHRLMLAVGGSDRTMEKIAALQEEINRDVDDLIDLKRNIVQMLRRLSKPEYQTVLELRWLRGWSWEKIAGNLHYSIGYIYALNSSAHREFSDILQRQEFF